MCCFLLAEEQKKWKTFFSHTFGSLCASVWEVLIVICLFVMYQCSCCHSPLPGLLPIHPSSRLFLHLGSFSASFIVLSLCWPGVFIMAAVQCLVCNFCCGMIFRELLPCFCPVALVWRLVILRSDGMVWLDLAPSFLWEVWFAGTLGLEYGDNDNGNDNDKCLYYFPSLFFRSNYINII